MSSQLPGILKNSVKFIAVATTCLAANNMAFADLFSSSADKDGATVPSLQHLTNLHSECLNGAIRKEEAGNLLGVVTVLSINQYCQETRYQLAMKTSDLKTRAFEAMYLKSYNLVKTGKLVSTAKPIDKIIDLE